MSCETRYTSSAFIHKRPRRNGAGDVKQLRVIAFDMFVSPHRRGEFIVDGWA